MHSPLKTRQRDVSCFLDLPTADLACVQNILKAHVPPSARVWVFGSRARGQAKRSSDLDLAIDAGRLLTRQECLGLEEAFEVSDLAYKLEE